MRRNEGWVLFSITIALALIAGIGWYAYLHSEADKQRTLQQAARGYLQEYKDGRMPAPMTPAEVWEAQEQRDLAAGSLPAAAAEQRASIADSIPASPAQSAAGGLVEGHGGALLAGGLLLAAVAAFGFAGSTYRLAKQGATVRHERDRLARELGNLRAFSSSSNGRPAPPWQEGALRMVRTSTVPMIAYDLDARVLEVSEGFARITGYSRADISDVETWFTKVLRTGEGELDAALKAFRDKVHGGDIETRTIWTRSGEERTWMCQPLEVWPLEGDALLLVERAIDVTEHAEAVRAARVEADALRASLNEASGLASAAVRQGSSREAELAADLAGLEVELERLRAQRDALTERLSAEQAQSAALRERDFARSAEHAQDERQQTTAVLDEAYQTSAAGLSVLDADLGVVRSNVRWQAMVRDAGGMHAVLAAIEPLARETLRFRSGTRDAHVRVRDASGIERIWSIDCQAITSVGGASTALALTAEDVTEQTARTARLQEAAERLQVLAEHLEEGLWIVDPRVPRVIYATPQAGMLRGLSPASPLEDFARWIAAVHPDDRERVSQAFLAAGTEGGYEIEYRVVREDGSIAWLRDRGVAVCDGQGRMRHLAGITTDVTVRKSADDAMRSALATLRTLVDHAPAILWLKDDRGRYLYANRKYGDLTGFSPEQLHGKTDFQVFPRAAAERMRENDARALAADGVRQFEETLQLSDGLHHFVALKCATRDATAAGTALCGVAIDVTARRRGEDALRAEESRYRAIVASLPYPLLIVRENKIVFANAAAASMLAAADADALVGMPLLQIAANADAAMTVAARALAQNGAATHRFDIRLQACDGREVEAEASAAVYETATERAVQFVLQDVGERNAKIGAVREAEAFFRGLCDATPVALRLLDGNARCVFASPAWEVLAGTGMGADWFDHVHPEDREKVRRSFEATAPRDEPACVEYRLRDAAGHERWILDTLLPRYDDQGRWSGNLSSAIDITARKRLEAELRAHCDDVAALLDRCPAPVWVSAAAGNGYANRACLAWLGADETAGSNLDLGEYVHPEDRAAWRHAHEGLVSEDVPLDGELRMRRADGVYRYVRFAAVLVPAHGETRFRRIGCLEDVSASREAAQALAIAEQRRAQIIGLLGAGNADGLTQVRHTAELVRVMFPEEPRMQQVSATVLDQAQRLEHLMEEMLVPLRSQAAAGAGEDSHRGG
jgi:PAS domain S-box-containing protein